VRQVLQQFNKSSLRGFSCFYRKWVYTIGMTQEEMELLAGKVADGTATDEEELAFYQELNKEADELLALAEDMPDQE
jgi:hypothetical protein